MGHPLPSHLHVSTADHRGLNSYPLNGHITRVEIDHAAGAIAAALSPHSIRCAYVDVFLPTLGPNGTERTRQTAALHDALKRRGIAPIPSWRSLRADVKGNLPGKTYFGPPMAAALLRLYYARHAAVLFVERGSQWGDVITMLRAATSSEHGAQAQPTYVMHASHGGQLELERTDGERCVRVRGRCVQTDRVPYHFVGHYC